MADQKLVAASKPTLKVENLDDVRSDFQNLAKIQKIDAGRSVRERSPLMSVGPVEDHTYLRLSINTP